MNLPDSFFKDELRSDFPVTKKRKQIWATELYMLKKFDQICKKYNLSYFVYYGTLLGAVRHHGFIPWDDDIDVVMFRDDYERFQSIAPSEFTEPYFFQNTYTDRLIWPFSKIRDSRTTGIEFPDMKDFNQGIFMDIFPLDSVPDGITESFSKAREYQGLLWNTLSDPEKVLLYVERELKAEKWSISEAQFFLDITKLDIIERFKVFEELCLAYFDKTTRLNYIMDELCPSNYKNVEKSWFKDTVYLPFENMLVPAPSEYDKALRQCYGDYHEFVHGGSSHQNIILDAEISYKEYFFKYLS